MWGRFVIKISRTGNMANASTQNTNDIWMFEQDIKKPYRNMQYSKDDWGCLCFVCLPVSHPRQCWIFMKRVYRTRTGRQWFCPWPTQLASDSISGAFSEASKRLLYLVAVSRTVFFQFCLILFGGYLYFQPFMIMKVLEHLLLLPIWEIGIIIPIRLLPTFHDTTYFQYSFF